MIKYIEALALVIELAEQNVLSERDVYVSGEPDLAQERDRQEQAISIVRARLDLVDQGG